MRAVRRWLWVSGDVHCTRLPDRLLEQRPEDTRPFVLRAGEWIRVPRTAV